MPAGRAGGGVGDRYRCRAAIGLVSSSDSPRRRLGVFRSRRIARQCKGAVGSSAHLTAVVLVRLVLVGASVAGGC